MSKGFKNLWQVETLRLSTFPSSSSQYEFNEEWWTSTLDSEPDSITSNTKSASFDLVGKFKDIENSKLVLHADPSRIDWILSSDLKNVDEIPIIDKFTNILDPLKKFTEHWLLNFCPNISRLAFGAILIIPAKSKVDSYKQLAKMLDWVEIDPENCSDFFYQINRPHETTIPISNKKINKLSKWMAVTLKVMQIQSSGTQGQIREIFHGSKLELDINTSADNTDDLPKDLLGNIYNELLESAIMVSNDGDKKNT